MTLAELCELSYLVVCRQAMAKGAKQLGATMLEGVGVSKVRPPAGWHPKAAV